MHNMETMTGLITINHNNHCWTIPVSVNAWLYQLCFASVDGPADYEINIDSLRSVGDRYVNGHLFDLIEKRIDTCQYSHFERE